MNETNTNQSVWSKTPDELTVSDQLKVTAVVTTIMVAAPLVIGYGYASVCEFRDRRAAKRAAKKAEFDKNVIDV